MRFNRRRFIGASAASLALARLSRTAEQKRLPLAFSTLACPDWEWKKILEFAEANHFAAIELRGLMGSLDLPSRPEFAADRLSQTKQEIDCARIEDRLRKQFLRNARECARCEGKIPC